MVDPLLFAATLFAALGSGLMAGVFFAFSTFVMRALARRPPAEATAAMQAINVAALPSPFSHTAVAATFGCLVVAAWGLAEWDDASTPFLLLGSALYVAGSMGVTAAFNLPRNDALARLDPEGAEAAEEWPRYLSQWTFWNHVRAAAALAASAALTAAVLAG
jgi:uncharacterized membrane protein